MPSVLIAGAGYAGIEVSRRLADSLDSSWTITLVSRASHHELLTRLPEVVGGRLAPSKARIAVQGILPRRVKFVQAYASDVDPIGLSIELDGQTMRGDFLVLALGSSPAFHRVPGARAHGHTVRSVQGAVSTRDAVRTVVREHGAAHVAIIGAGYTATEVAGWLGDPLASLGGGRVEVSLVAEDSRLLPLGNERVAELAQTILAEKGVRCRLSTSVRSVTPGRVHLADGAEVAADVVVWGASGQAGWPGLGRGLRFATDRRILVDEYLRVDGVPRMYVVGDCAAPLNYRDGNIVPANAQLGLQEAGIAARNIAAEIEGARLKAFRPLTLGEALDLGPSDGVADVLGIVVRGRSALAVKRAALNRYLYGLGGLRLLREYR